MMLQAGFRLGRIICMSKSSYRIARPKNYTVFNCNVFAECGKFWYGDLDLTIDGEKLRAISVASGNVLCVLYEMDGRFENEDLAFETALSMAIAKFMPDGSVVYKKYDRDIRDYVEIKIKSGKKLNIKN